jgi:pyruvate formate lyase activating enzyme
MQKAILFEKEKNGVRCTACKQGCLISEGKTGICGVRKNVKGILYLTVYGKPVSVNIDPIEKKPLFHFLPGTKIFSLGTVGCNFSCAFCQNWDISQAGKAEPKINFSHDLPPEEIVKICVEKKIPSIAYTYNEPAIFFEYAYDTAKLSHKKGIKNVFVSNGYETDEALEKIRPYLDAINVDLKAFTEDFYQKICHAKLSNVLDTIKKIHELGIWMEITTLVIPGKNDSINELTEIAKFISGIDENIPWHVSAFHPDYKMAEINQTPSSTLSNAYKIGKKVLNHVYVGNVLDDERESTFCPKCRAKVIRRSGFSVDASNIHNGKCSEKIAGVWS